jgi:hypothetical protein
VGKGERADIYLEVRKRGAYIFLMKQVPVGPTSQYMY